VIRQQNVGAGCAHDVAHARRGRRVRAEARGVGTEVEQRAAPKRAEMHRLAVAQRARLLVSGDTGPLHIAGAVGTPIVALFGPTRWERNGPWSPADGVVTRYERCQCHYERHCRLSTPCIDDIGVDEVMAAVERRLDAVGSAFTRPVNS